MIIHYAPGTLSVIHTLTQWTPEYMDYLATQQNWIEWHGAASIDQIRLQMVDGVVTVVIIPRMEIVAPTTMTVGQEATFTAVPDGTTIFVNGTELGVMDASGALEFTPNTGGAYTFSFRHPNYVTSEVQREALSI